MRRRYAFTEWAVFALVLFGIGSNSWLVAQQPNVVVFLVDDMGWVDWQRDAAFNPHGSDLYETPNMLRLAQTGVVFSDAYAASPVCSPTRSSILTGKNPARTRITEWISGGNHDSANLTQPPDWDKNLDSSEITLAEALKASGYNTGFFGKWHLGQSGNSASNPLNHGFDVNIGGAHFGSPPGGHFAGADGGWPVPGLESGYPTDAFLADAVSTKAADYVAQASNQQAPFFAMVSHYAVHAPIQAPQALINKYDAKKSQLLGQGVDLEGHTNSTYAGLVEKMDESLGRILDRLEDPNGDGSTNDSVRDNTLIIFASDNGGLLGPTDNRPLREGKGSLYEGGIREPFMVSWTGNTSLPDLSGAQGRVESARTSAHDIYATVLDAAGLLDDGLTPQTPTAERDGISLLPALVGGAYDRGYQYWHYPHFSNQDNNSSDISGGSFVSAVRKDDWKLIYDYDTQGYELYNLGTDLGETSNVLNANPTVAAELSQALRSYLEEVDAQMPVSLSTGQPVDLPAVVSPPEPIGAGTIVVPTSATWLTGQSQYSSDNIFASDKGLVDGSTVEHGDPLPDTFPQHTSGNGVNGGNTLPPGETAVDVSDVLFRTFHGSETAPFSLVINFDATYDLEGMILWNFAAKFNGSYTNNRGLKDVDIYYSTDGGETFSTTPAVSLTNIDQAEESLLTDADLISFGSVITANALRFDITNHGGSFTGINELRFYTAAASLVGDYNDDGVVNLTDYTVWRNHLGGTANSLPNRAEALAGTPIGQADFQAWKQNFGSTSAAMTAASESSSAVPEPSAWSLVIGPSVVVLLSRSGRSRGSRASTRFPSLTSF